MRPFSDYNWYMSVYTDVKKSGLKTNYHYKLYGKAENRLKNLRSFLNISKNSKWCWTDYAIRALFRILNLTTLPHIKSKIFYFISLLEVSKLKKHNFKTLIITSWLDDGVSEAVKLYSKAYSKGSKIGVLRGLRHSDGSNLKPMILEIIENAKIIDCIPLIYPLTAIEQYDSKISKITSVHTHHIFDIEFFILSILKTLNFYYVVYLHDYYILTKKLHLFDESTKAIKLDFACSKYPNNLIDLKLVLDRTRLFICPSVSAYIKFKDYIPNSKLKWAYHPEETDLELKSVKKIKQKKFYRICIIGNMGPYKGSDVIAKLINTIKSKNLPYKLYHFGKNPLMPNNAIYCNFTNLSRSEMLLKINSLNLDFAFLPYQAEETYSFTLSDIFNLHLPLVSTKVGAIPERCLGRESTILLSPSSDTRLIIKAFKKLVTGEHSHLNTFIPNYLSDARKRITLKNQSQP